MVNYSENITNETDDKRAIEKMNTICWNPYDGNEIKPKFECTGGKVETLQTKVFLLSGGVVMCLPNVVGEFK